MSGWQKIGVTLSVLWLIGLPGLCHGGFQPARQRFLRMVLKSESKIASGMTAQEQQEWCLRSRLVKKLKL